MVDGSGKPECGRIYEAICGVMEDIGAVGKNDVNKQQGFKYRSIDAVMNALSPAMIKHKVFCVPELLEQSRELCAAALLALYGQKPEENCREIASILAKNLTKFQIMRTIELLQKYRGECAYNVGTGHVLGALAVELEGIL